MHIVHCKSIRSLNSGTDVACLQFDVTFETMHCMHGKIISQKWNKNETDKAFLCSIVQQYNKITY